MLFYIIVYDIPCDKRRQKISELLEGYGKRVQYSVFECLLNQSQYTELKKRLHKQINSSEDSIRFYPLSKHTFNQIETWGEPPITEIPGSIII
ncbi:CRISPR-associated endonuclease Cas2 [Cuspidothrix issatschenkoi LEGE 03284]|uniref:CRISPR-associated endoribonuclease Cas2 n=1 Tax=Cuspidothrix issatschenkoi CHARLIE-1 TaxID=2052836 RepID=A0A2S6CT27_9CYAN|nr:CRISPR-associated endonuclease Cas2 [Cuspidothrix issatschenkoi]MBE9233284.1 CRISPR-associated endonuclease Cas2 [Cuspidothrix issatschenkoi LEGE 03284]PPJ62841.1 CRISPR-associated endonuclease Cas2 [Cuspidothrix issatschenkoi CHARLIE-1]